jgi:electron transport complex protein RnfG
VADIIKLTLALTVIAALSGLAIGAANVKTRDKIAEQELRARNAAIEAVFPKGAEIGEMRDSGGILPGRYWNAFIDGKLAGHAFEMSGAGYAGDIKFMVGVGLDGKILGMTVISHDETPGLGDRVNEVASTKYIWNLFAREEKPKPWFAEQFEGLSALRPIAIDKGAGEWHALDAQARAGLKDKNAVTAITGSTVTTAAFTRAIGKKIAPYLEELGGYCCPATRKQKESEELPEVSIEGTD